MKYTFLSLSLIVSTPAFSMIPIHSKDLVQHPSTPVTASSEESQGWYVKTELEKLRDSIPHNSNGYESDSEKGLDQHGKQVYRYNKVSTSIKHSLFVATPFLIEWFKDPINTTPSQRLSELAKQLDGELNRFEAYQSQINEYKNISGYESLKTATDALSNQIDASVNYEVLKDLPSDLSNPVVHFLSAFNRLHLFLK